MIAIKRTLIQKPNDKYRQLSIAHGTFYNNNQNQYRIIRYKRSRNNRDETIQTRKLTA